MPELTHNEITRKLMNIFFLYRRLHRQQESPFLGIKHSELVVMFCIKEHAADNDSGLTISALSQSLKVTSPTITQLINNLEKNDLVKRSIDPDDRRSVRVTLTEHGAAVVKKASKAFLSLYSGLVEYLGKEKSLLLLELLSESIDYFNEVTKKRQAPKED